VSVRVFSEGKSSNTSFLLKIGIFDTNFTIEMSEIYPNGLFYKCTTIIITIKHTALKTNFAGLLQQEYANEYRKKCRRKTRGIWGQSAQS
jgi:hypothetical protein